MLLATWIEWWYFTQLPALKIQMKDVLIGCKFPALHMLATCELPHNSNTIALWPRRPSSTLADSPVLPRPKQGWNVFLDSNLFQGRFYQHESLSNSICISHAVAARFPFNHSWWWTHCKPFLYAPLLFARGLGWLLAFFSLELWFRDSMGDTGKQGRGSTFLPFRPVSFLFFFFSFFL